MKYIDVSEHQGRIDWEAARGSIDGAILRAGCGKGRADLHFARNARECSRLGIPWGAYWFSYAWTCDMARKEAEALLRAVGGYSVELPLAFDYEYDSVRYGEKQGAVLTAALVRDMAETFCRTVEDAGYRCLLYANPDFISRYFGSLTERYDLWLAEWPRDPDPARPPRKCGVWQWGGSSIPGVPGVTDTNEAYRDYAALRRAEGRPWYAEAMDWAREQGVCDGLRPEDAATRAEVAQMIFNLEKRRENHDERSL